MASIKTAVLVYGFQFSYPLDDDEILVLSRYDVAIIQSQTDVLPVGTYEPPQDWSKYLEIMNAAKALNPDFRAIVYASAAPFQRQWEPFYPAITSGVRRFHKPDGTDLIYDDGALAPSRFRWFNIAHEGVRAGLIAYILDFLEDNNLDGFLIDGWQPYGFGASIALSVPSGGQFGLAGGIQEGPAHTSQYWVDALQPWTNELTDAFEAEGHRVWINGLSLTAGYDPTDAGWLWIGNGQVNTAQYGSGFMLENGHKTYGDVSRATQVLDLFEAGLAFGKEAWFQAFPGLLGGVDLTPPGYTEGLELQRFYLNVYLQVANERTFFNYYQTSRYDPDNDPSTSNFLHWCGDWDLDHGEPTGVAFKTSPDTMRWRRYTRGYSVVNLTGGTLVFNQPGTYHVDSPTDGHRVVITNDVTTHYVLPPYSGHFLWV